MNNRYTTSLTWGIPLFILVLAAALTTQVEVSSGAISKRFATRWAHAQFSPAEHPPSIYNLQETIFINRFPIVSDPNPILPVEISQAWTAESDGTFDVVFFPGDPIYYYARGTNPNSTSTSAVLTWSQSGPCGTTEIFNEALTLSPGDWEHSFSTPASDCPGIYTGAAQISQWTHTAEQSTIFVTNPLTNVIVNTHQGFDKCRVPNIEDMLDWWDNSPYYSINLYIGGISLGCENERLTPFWINAVAEQGWTFIPTWVGPQAPCTSFNHRISWDPGTAYQEGRAEADAAAAAGAELGFSPENIIYLDIEGYASASSGCRDAVKSHVRGWVERMEELDLKGGAYGSPCGSYISDWATVTPPPTSVWIAHWYTTSYDPDATVWNTPCLSNALWTNHQRIKQYAGDHRETWGSTRLTIDSDVLDGEVVELPFSSTNTAAPETIKIPQTFYPQIQAMGLISPDDGWLLTDENLWVTHNGAENWLEITPPLISPERILTAAFHDPVTGWAVSQPDPFTNGSTLHIWQTKDGGITWQVTPLQLSSTEQADPISQVYLEFFDGNTGWVVLKRPSSNSFSLGRLFATVDGGRTWQERSIPLGEPVRFLDENRGWTTGGLTGKGLFGTTDGGNIWQTLDLRYPAQPAPEEVFIGTPVVDSGETALLPVTLVSSEGTRLALYTLGENGIDWTLDQTIKLEGTHQTAEPIPFDQTAQGIWRAAVPGRGNLLSASAPGRTNQALSEGVLPQGVFTLDFNDGNFGWALGQEGTCRGMKLPLSPGHSPGLDEIRCASYTHLFKTADGGKTWEILQLP